MIQKYKKRNDSQIHLTFFIVKDHALGQFLQLQG